MKVLSFRDIIRMNNITNIIFEIEVDSIKDYIEKSVIKINGLYFYIMREPKRLRNDVYILNINSIGFNEYMYGETLSDLILDKDIEILDKKINNYEEYFNFQEKLENKN